MLTTILWLLALHIHGQTSQSGTTQEGQWNPDRGVPVAARQNPTAGRPMDAASLVVLVRVVQKTTVERGDDSPDWPEAVRDREESWEYAMAYVLDVPRVNERRATEPDLKERCLLVDQRDRAANPIKFELGAHLRALPQHDASAARRLERTLLTISQPAPIRDASRAGWPRGRRRARPQPPGTAGPGASSRRSAGRVRRHDLRTGKER